MEIKQFFLDSVENTEEAQSENLANAMTPEMDNADFEGIRHSTYPVRPFGWSRARDFGLSLRETDVWRKTWRLYARPLAEGYWDGKGEKVTPESFKTAILNEPFHRQHIRMTGADKEMYPLEWRQRRNEPLSSTEWAEDMLTRALHTGDHDEIKQAFTERGCNQ